MGYESRTRRTAQIAALQAGKLALPDGIIGKLWPNDVAPEHVINLRLEATLELARRVVRRER